MRLGICDIILSVSTPKEGTMKKVSNSEMHARYRKMRVNGKQVNVARYVMEQKLGRPLQLSEYVHHINGNKLDDRPENLELTTPKVHSIIHNAGKPGNRLGKHHTPEAKAKISAYRKGKPTVSHWLGKHLSPEHKSKLSIALKGRPSPNKGKHTSPETKAKISASMKIALRKRD